MEKGKVYQDEVWKEKGKQSFGDRHRRALELIKEEPIEEPVLDLGCGDGLFLSLLQKEGFHSLTGVDISQVALEKAKKRLGKEHNIDLICHDFGNGTLPFVDNSFRTACLLDVLEHQRQPKEVLKEVHRVAKKLVIVVPNFNSLMARINVLLGRTPSQNKLKRGGHIYWVNKHKLESLLHQCGFRIERTLPYIYKMHQPFIGKLVYELGRLRPSIFATSFGVRATSDT